VSTASKPSDRAPQGDPGYRIVQSDCEPVTCFLRHTGGHQPLPARRSYMTCFTNVPYRNLSFPANQRNSRRITAVYNAMGLTMKIPWALTPLSCHPLGGPSPRSSHLINPTTPTEFEDAGKNNEWIVASKEEFWDTSGSRSLQYKHNKLDPCLSCCLRDTSNADGHGFEFAVTL
jgi:hypothetical protein